MGRESVEGIMDGIDILDELEGKEREGLRLRALRRRRNLTQADLTKMAHCRGGIIGQLELGRQYVRPKIAELEGIARVLHYAPIEIFPFTYEQLITGAAEYLTWEAHPEDMNVPRLPCRGVQFA